MGILFIILTGSQWMGCIPSGTKMQTWGVDTEVHIDYRFG